jgi:hypothetical protein
MGRCFLARLCGDAINAVLAAAGANLRKLLGLLRRGAGWFVYALCDTGGQLALALIRWLDMPIRRIEMLTGPWQSLRITYPTTA